MQNTSLSPEEHINYFIIRKTLWSSTFYLNRYGAILWMVLGLILNPLAFIVWTRPKLRRHNTSSNYLAGIAVADFLFWLLYFLFYLKHWWNISIRDVPFWCELFQGLFISMQYFSVPLVLIFSIERYIAVCHPFKRDKICTHRRALFNTIGCGIFVFILGFIQIATVHFSPRSGTCEPREIIVRSIYWTIFQTATEIIISALIPIATLIVNILVIVELRKITTKSTLLKPKLQYSNSDNNSNDYNNNNNNSNYSNTNKLKTQNTESKEKNAFRSSTILLLSVSFLLIVTTLPVGLVYSFQFLCPNGNETLSLSQMLTDPDWLQFAHYQIIKELVDFFAQIHFVINFVIYYVTGDNFRQEFHELFNFSNKSRSNIINSSFGSAGSTNAGNRRHQMILHRESLLVNNSHGTTTTDVPLGNKRVNRTEMIRKPFIKQQYHQHEKVHST